MMHACGGVGYKKELGRSAHKGEEEKGRKDSEMMRDPCLPSVWANVFRFESQTILSTELSGSPLSIETNISKLQF